MMNNKEWVIIDKTKLTAIADTVRATTKSENLIEIDDLGGEVARAIQIGSGLNTYDATADASEIMQGETAYANGMKITGTFTIENELNRQDNLIEQITSALEGKALPRSETEGDDNMNTLNGKKILLLGDSVGAGNGWQGGFANCILEDYPEAIVNNGAVSGARLVNKEIYGELVTAFTNGFAADYIVFDGGGNDLLLGAPNGTLDMDTYTADGYGNDFDANSIVGAFEYLVTNMQKFFPNAKVVFYNLYKLHPEATELTYARQREVWTLLRQVAEKYGVSYVDLYNKGNFSPNSEEQWNAFMYDWVHINEAGYRRFWPLLEQGILFA